MGTMVVSSSISKPGEVLEEQDTLMSTVERNRFTELRSCTPVVASHLGQAVEGMDDNRKEAR